MMISPDEGRRPITDQKIFFFDVETTGLDPKLHDIVQISGLIEYRGQVVKEFDLKCQPINWDSISQEALDITCLTLDDLKGFPDHNESYQKLIKIMDSVVDKYDKTDKMIIAGYNVDFDITMLQSFFEKHGNKYMYSYFNSHRMDVYRVLNAFWGYNDMLRTFPDLKLETVARQFGIKHEAHDALSDIRVTRRLAHRIIAETPILLF